MAKVTFLVLEIVLMLLQLAVIICNGFILFLFTVTKNLRQNSPQLLVLFLTATDFLHALATIPYAIYLLISWSPVYLDLNPYYVMIGSAPFTVQLKINLSLTISIATERTLALFIPVSFRKISSRSYAWFGLLFGFLLAVLDLILEFSFWNFKRAPGCVSMGCFLNNKFRYYLGISNMVMGITVIVLTSFISIKLRAIQQKPQPVGVLKAEEKSLIQANRYSFGILIISLVFVTLPSVGVGFCAITGIHISKAVGPFYIVGLVGAGFCNGIVHIALNKDIRALAANYIGKKGRALAGLGNATKTIFIKF